MAEEALYEPDVAEQSGDPKDPLGLRAKLASRPDPLGLRAKVATPYAGFQLHISTPDFKSTPVSGANEFSFEKPVDELGVTKLKNKALEAQAHLHSEIQSNRDVKEKLVKQKRAEEYAAAIPQPVSDQPQTQSDIDVQRLIKPSVKPQDLPVSDEEIAKEDQEYATDRGKAVRLLEKTGELKPEKKQAIQKSLYVLDVANTLANDEQSAARTKKIEKNAKGIEKGDLTYDARTGTLMRPTGLIGSAIEGYKQKEKLFSDYDFLKNTDNDSAIASQLDDDRTNHDPDEPIPIPKGKLSEITQGLGGMPLKPLAGGLLAGIVNPAAGVAAGAVIGGRENAKLEYAATFKRTYYELLDQGVDKFEAVNKARSQAEQSAEIGAVTGGAMGLIGSNLGLRAPLPNFSQSFTKAAIDVAKKSGGHGLLAGAIGAGGEIIKNKLAQNIGINRPIDEGVGQAIESNLLMTVGLAAAIKAGKGMTGPAYRTILNGVSKLPPEIIQEHLTDKVNNGEITQKAADETLQRITEYKGLDQLIPDDVTEEARFKIQDKIKKRIELEDKLEGTDKAFHEPIKEKIKLLNEEIVGLSKEKIETEKPTSELPKEKAKEAAEFAEELLHEGLISDAYDETIKKDPVGFWKQIAQQAQNRDENWKSISEDLPEQAVRDQWGDTVVDYAKELFPAPEIAEPINNTENGVSISEAENIPVGEQAETSGEAKKSGIGPTTNPDEPESNAQNQEGVTPPPTIENVPLEEGQPRNVTSLKNAVTDEKRKQFGFAPAMQAARKEFGASWDEGMQKIEDGYNPRDLVTDLKKKARPLTDVENAILLKHQVDLETEHHAVNEAINQAAESGDEATVAENKIKKARIQDELNDIYDVGKAAGTENARGLNARKLMARDDYSLASLVSKKRAANDGAPLTAEQTADLEQKHAEIQAKLKAYEARISELENQVKELQTKKPLKQKVETVVKNIRNLKINKGDKLQASFAAIPVAIWDGAVETIAKAVEGGAALADAIQQGIAHLKANGHLNSKGEEEDFINHIYVNAGEERPFANLLDKETIKLKADYERAKANFDSEIYKDEQAKRSGFAKASDFFVKWERAGKLSWPSTLAKLASAGLTRLITSPIEDAVGAGIGKLLPKEVTGKAHGEAGFNVKAQAKAFTEAFTTGMKDSYDTMSKGRLGKSDIDFAFGDRKITLPPEVADLLGKLHGAIKAPIKRGIFEKSLEKRIANNIRMGNDITDPMVQTNIAVSAYKDAQRAIFMQDNWASKKYQSFISMLERDKDFPTVSKAFASGMQFLIPFVKVPTNIVGETATLSGGGLVAGGIKLMHTAFTKGLKNLEPVEADMIMRNLKKGAIGTAALLLGYFSPKDFGGFYQEKEKRKEGDLKANQMRIFGVQIPSWLLHSPIFNAMQLGATVRRVKDKYMEEGKDDPTLNGIMAGGLGLIKEVPLAEQPMEVAKLFDPQERNYYVGQLAKNTIDPGILQYIAKIEQGYNPWTENTAHKPQPATILEHIETGLPVLTENVSTKKHNKKHKK